MKNLHLLLGIVVIVALLAACAPQPAPAPKPAPAPSPAPAPAPAPAPKPAPAVGQPKYGGTMRFWSPGQPGGFDMHRKPGFAGYLSLPVFNNLVRFDPTVRETSPETIAPDLAERWVVSPDGKTFTFYLRKGVRWHDGKPFTADDVVYSIEKMMDAKRSTIKSSYPAYDSIQKVDDSTVKIMLKSPSPAFLEGLTSLYANIQPKHKAEVDWRSTDFLVGTGAYKFKSASAGLSYEMVKNPEYFKKDKDGRQLPYLDALSMTVIVDRSAQIDALATGRLDMAAPTSGITAQESYDRLKSQAKDIMMQSRSPAQPDVYWLNPSYGPLKDIRVRRALALIVDRKQLVIAERGADMWAKTERAFFTSFFGLPPDEINKLVGWDKPMDARIAEAKKLMAEAGYASGFKLKMVARNLPEYQKNLTLLADLFRRNLNIEAEIVTLPVAEAEKLRNAGDFHLWLDMALSLSGDPDQLMGYFTTGGSDNFLKYSNPKADALWQEQSRTLDAKKRAELTREIERTLLTDLYTIPVKNAVFVVAWWPYVKGFVVQDMAYSSNLAFEYSWLDK